MAKQKAKKRHIANSDTDSENSYPVSQPTNSSSSTSTKKPYAPRFLIIHSEKEGETISSLSPFVVHKTMSIAGEQKSIKNLRSGDFLIQCAKESHEKSLLQMKTFCGLKFNYHMTQPQVLMSRKYRDLNLNLCFGAQNNCLIETVLLSNPC